MVNEKLLWGEVKCVSGYLLDNSLDLSPEWLKFGTCPPYMYERPCVCFASPALHGERRVEVV